MTLARMRVLRTRDERLERHAYLPRQVALRLIRRLPRSVELGDLIGAGSVGLVVAADRYDASRGVPFEAYARNRVQGAMLDHLRGEDPLTRGERAAEKQRRAAAGADAQPSLRLVSLNEADDHALADSGRDPHAACESAQQSAGLRQAIGTLPQRERTVISLYYAREMTLRQIGGLLLVSESRVCQILRGAVARLRHLLVAQ